MIVAPDFLDHWKTRMLVRRTGDPTAPFLILRLWAHCQVSRRWRFPAMTGEILASICHSQLDGEALKTILSDCGFIRAINGTIVIHQWDAFNRTLVNSWNNGSKGGRKKKPIDNPEGTRGLPTGNPSNLILSNLICTLKEGVRGRFEEWMKFRRANFKKVKDFNALFGEQAAWLNKFSEAEQLEIIAQSMRQGWQGLFPPKRKSNGAPTLSADTRRKIDALRGRLKKLTYHEVQHDDAKRAEYTALRSQIEQLERQP